MILTRHVVKALKQVAELNDSIYIRSNYRHSWFTQSEDGKVQHSIELPKEMTYTIYDSCTNVPDDISYETFRIKSITEILKYHDDFVSYFDPEWNLELFVDTYGDINLSDRCMWLWGSASLKRKTVFHTLIKNSN